MKWVAAAAVAAVVGSVQADQRPFFRSKAYENGEYGQFPQEEYKTTELTGPRANYYEYDGSCTGDGLYVMITPRGGSVKNPGPMVLDEKGALVWTDSRYRQPYNLMVQTYKGEQYLTFWAGDDGVRGHGAGTYYMLDSTYNETYTVGAANGLQGDLHEFKITEEGTALLTAYIIVPIDLSSIGGPKDGWIWDGVFQEVNIETRELIFEWRASQHLKITDTYHDMGSEGLSHDAPFDWFHINSVDKDSDGNYMISSRHLHSITKINGTSGEIMWILGGKSNMFKDLSDGAATSFSWQHHARWRDNFTAISMFDNQFYGLKPADGPSRGLLIDLDTADSSNLTARVRTTYMDPGKFITLSQGSLQFLPNGNVLLGYGYNAMYTEFSANGDVLCDVHFGPSSQFGGGEIQSYRVMKYPWVGKPTTKPVVVGKEGTLAMSWMGATEVTHWRIESAEHINATSGQFYYQKLVRRRGFETKTTLSSTRGRFVRVLALDQSGEILGISETIDSGLEPLKPIAVILPATLISLGIVSGFTAIAYGIFRWYRYRKYQRAHDEEVDDDVSELDEEKTKLTTDIE